MSRFELISYPDAEALAQGVAEEWCRQMSAGSHGAAPYGVALSGGRIARGFFSAVAALASKAWLRRETAKQGTGDAEGGGEEMSASPSPCFLDRVHFFWGDERCVPPQDPESNFGLAHQLLLQPLGIPETRVHRIPGEQPPATAAALAQAELCRLAPLTPDGQPVLDLVFLGMGEDGHVASLFPGEPPELFASRAVFRPVVATKPPPHRVTLGYAAIVAAREVWVLASGSGKQEALRQSLAPGGQTPLARVLRLRSQTRILTDVAL